MNFDLWLEKYFLGVVLAFVALAAYFQAAGATQLIGTALSGPATGAPPSRVMAAAASTHERPTADATFFWISKRKLSSLPKYLRVDLSHGEFGLDST